ncbi:ComEC/Rec2 family competence protein [Xanthobacter sp. AM11]|uniref:ComEC/Rec2 family competence protein n=1 Tax=Xanthobacter sp. AM11 TaxID=3380643 RepID=UPI0039BF3ED8
MGAGQQGGEGQGGRRPDGARAAGSAAVSVGAPASGTILDVAGVAGFGAGWRPGLPSLRPALAGLARRIGADFSAEATSGRLILWLPAAYALGILFYFAAAREPFLPAVLLLTLALSALAVAARARPVAFGALVALASVAGGFATGGVRTALVAREAIAAPAGPVRLVGFVEKVEHRTTGDRILLRLDGGAVRGLHPAPALVRLTLRRGWAPPVGARVSQLARLLPPLGPAMPGAHDFGRGPWFRGIDAVGYGLGRPRPDPGGAAPVSVKLAMLVDAARDGLARRIRASLTGTPAEIAVALVAGDRSAIAPEVEESMRVSGLTHILSISGLHMALVAGTLFALVRGALALGPGLALGFPIKSLAAAAALAGSAAYLVLSGNDVPAQRSFVMTALVLAGVMAGRPALTLRTVGVAAVVVLALTPEAVLEPGTQMSFAATLALVAAYERLRPLRALPRPDGLAGQAAVWVAVLVGGTALTAVVAGLATAPYGMFHFQRVAPYGLLANLAAMPAVSFLVMPFGLVGVLLMPFGFDHLAWPVMGLGIEIMVAVSDHIAGLPGADMRAAWVGGATLAGLSLALLGLCLLRGAAALVALLPLGFALATAGPAPRPDLLVASDAQTVAVRGADGRLSILGARTNRLVAEQWLTREGDRRTARAGELAAGFTCDGEGCTAPLPGGGTLAVSQRAEGLEADCLNARLVVTRETPPGDCPAQVLTPALLARTGTQAFYFRDNGWHMEPTRTRRVQRPWMPPLPPEPEATAAPDEPAELGPPDGRPAENAMQADAWME